MIPASELKARYRFEQRGEDANGDPLGAFEPGFTVWARPTWLRGGEAVMGERLEGKKPVVLTVRETSQTRGITSAFRAVDGAGTVFNITAVSPAKESGFIDILATAGGAEG